MLLRNCVVSIFLLLVVCLCDAVKQTQRKIIILNDSGYDKVHLFHHAMEIEFAHNIARCTIVSKLPYIG